jgi:tetratricopeptide (TPR) repeat protein
MVLDRNKTNYILLSYTKQIRYFMRSNLLISIGAWSLVTATMLQTTAIAQVLVHRDRVELSTLDSSIVIAQNNSSLAERYNKSGKQKAETGDYQGGLADFNEAIKLNPKYAKAYSNRGGLKLVMNDIKGALVDLNQAINLDPNYALAYTNRGGLKMKLKDYQGALIDLNRAIKLDPNNKEAYNNRALARYHYLQDKAGGISDLQKLAILLQQEGKQADAKFVLGTIRKWKLEMKKVGAV